MVSAFAARQRLVLGQVKVADKANEIVAIPRLLDMLAIEGAVVTIDAMGCQRAIARKVLDKKADYIFALKGNQGTLHEDVELFAAEQKASNFKDSTVSRARTVDGDHGRIETRDITVIHDIDWLQKNHRWPGLNSVVMVQSTRETGGKIERETRFYITSLVLIASLIGPLIRDHWATRTASIGCSIWSSEMTNVPANRSRSRKFHHIKTYGAQSHPSRTRQGLLATKTKGRSMGR
ncbi:ISAs1 family transposase [Mesorhizobium ventifaucium]|uniref:Transposase IS4-like domain-containing protein n=1 Tax=Mesorhizobium ventifaucium TaxID=666020 RepID=A0ABM9DCY7_9HYPH|nr:ISAs1 family transposase [Mesorhizobium ventifaucium]CAH2394397.1 hypothetical protein MES4922_10310 [Mesorhizobium ventifaucium]